MTKQVVHIRWGLGNYCGVPSDDYTYMTSLGMFVGSHQTLCKRCLKLFKEKQQRIVGVKPRRRK